MKSKLVLILCLIFLLQGTAFAFSNPFSKKQDKEKEEEAPMVHTVDEWMESATSIKMDLRKREEDQFKEDDGVIAPAEKPLYIERYNVKAGSKEINLTELYKTKNIRSIFVSDPGFENAVYSEIYFYPQTKQAASTLFLIELDKNLSKKERLSDVSIFEHTRYPLISTALSYLRQGFFSTLTVVDFSKDGKKILVKEKRGSNNYGTYETYAWVYFLTDEPKENNKCYTNNVDFAGEMQIYGGLDGGYGTKDNNYEKMEPYELDIAKINNPPNEIISNDKAIQKDAEEKTGSTVELKEGLSPNIKANENSNWLKEEVTVIEKKSYGGMKEEDVPHLDYREVRNFIKSTWLQDEMNSSAKTRWYNTVPVDFRVDIPYNEKANLGFGVRLNLLNEMIKAYWFNRSGLFLNYIRWDLKVLGFSNSNGDEIITEAIAFDKNGKEISLGYWAANIEDGLVRLVPDDEKIEIQANGFYLEGKLNPR